MPNNYFENQNTEEPRPAQPASFNEPPVSQEVPQDTSQTQPNMPNSSSGQLVVSVFTANQIYPVVDAQVSVEAQNGDDSDVLGTSVTDRNGRSTTFTLPAPSAAASQEPTTLPPFAQYRVRIKHPDFFDAVIENVQIFGGVLTRLPVNLVPLPELSDGERTNIVIIPIQNL